MDVLKLDKLIFQELEICTQHCTLLMSHHLQGCSGVTNESCAVIGKLVGLTSLLLNHCNHVGDQGESNKSNRCPGGAGQRKSLLSQRVACGWTKSYRVCHSCPARRCSLY
jgi:hypothetical protein